MHLCSAFYREGWHEHIKAGVVAFEGANGTSCIMQSSVSNMNFVILWTSLMRPKLHDLQLYGPTITLPFCMSRLSWVPPLQLPMRLFIEAGSDENLPNTWNQPPSTCTDSHLYMDARCREGASTCIKFTDALGA